MSKKCYDIKGNMYVIAVARQDVDRGKNKTSIKLSVNEKWRDGIGVRPNIA